MNVEAKVLPVEGKVSPVEGKGDEKECSETEKANRANRGKTREQEAEMSQLNKVIRYQLRWGRWFQAPGRKCVGKVPNPGNQIW